MLRSVVACAGVALALVGAGACSGGAGRGGGPTTTAAEGSTTTTSSTPWPYAPSWSAVHADPANTDYSPVQPAPALERAWTVHIEGTVDVGPLPWTINLGPTSDPDGNLYVTSTEDGCHLRAVEGATGELRWCAEALDLLAVVSSPTIDEDGNLYVADGTGMHALRADGTERWHVPLSGVPLSSQFTSDGELIFVTHTGTLYVLDRATGAERIDPIDLAPGTEWEPGGGMMACARGTEACPSANTIAFDARRDVLYFTLWGPGEDRAGLRAMRYEGGPDPSVEPLWTNDALPGGSASSPVVSEDGSRVYVTDNVDALHALDADSGEVAWSYPIGYASGGSPSLSPGGLIIPAGGTEAPLQAIRDAGDRPELAWARDDLHNRGIAAQTAGDRAYATVSAGGTTCDLVELDTTDGTTLHQQGLPGACVFSVGITVGPDGTVFVPTIVGRLHAYR